MAAIIPLEAKSRKPNDAALDALTALVAEDMAAVNQLIASGDYTKIFAKWDVPGTGITKSVINPAPTF